MSATEIFNLSRAEVPALAKGRTDTRMSFRNQ
jgi:hypothetical protein